MGGMDVPGGMEGCGGGGGGWMYLEWRDVGGGGGMDVPGGMGGFDVPGGMEGCGGGGWMYLEGWRDGCTWREGCLQNMYIIILCAFNILLVF